MKWILVLLSGGLDSTGMLYSILENPEYKEYGIHVHTMCLLNVEERGWTEVATVKKIKEWILEHYPDREIIFTQSTHEYRFMNRGKFIWDADMTAWMSAHIMSHDDREYIYRAVGRTRTDVDIDIQDYSSRLLRALNIYDAAWFGEQEKPETIAPLERMFKIDIWNMMPPDLRELTWSCRHPVKVKDGWVPCNDCITCKAGL